MRIYSLAICLCVLLTGCVTTVTDEDGNPIGEENLGKELVIDDAGRIIARPTLLKAPHTIIVNGDTPTEREIRLLVVEGLPEEEAPTTYMKIQEWMGEYLAEEEEIYIKPSFDADLDAEVIYGMVYLKALDPGTGEPIPGGYVNVNMAMLSQGLVKIRDLREVKDQDLRERLREAEEYARREKLGLWSSDK